MIEILHYEKANKNKVIGYVDIKVTLDKVCMIIRKIAHFQHGDKKWFNYPIFARDKADGTPAFLRYWQLELEVHNGQLLEALHEKVKEYCQKNNIEEVKALDFDASEAVFSINDELPF